MSETEFLVGKRVEELRYALKDVRLVFDHGDEAVPALYVDLPYFDYVDRAGVVHAYDRSDPATAGTALAVVGEVVEHVSTDDGVLVIGFSDGSRLRCPPDERYESWHVVGGSPESLVIAGPAGELIVFDERSPTFTFDPAAEGFGDEVDGFVRELTDSLRSLSPAMQLIHTCYRITDIDRSVAFYTALGFEELNRAPIRDEAINVFMGLPGDGPRLELTYNFGVDSYELGTGYGHVAVTVEDLDATLERLAGQGIEPERPPYQVREGGSRLCFVRDPDGYRIELIERR